MLKLDDGVVRPEAAADFVAQDHFARRFQQHSQDLERLLLKPDPAPRFRSSPARRSNIAVLPFADRSGDKESEYFSDGLAEEIINSLTRTPGLKVVAIAMGRLWGSWFITWYAPK